MAQFPPRISREGEKRRKAFVAARHAELRTLCKMSRWKKNDAWLYQSQDDFFVDAFFVGHGHQLRTSVQVSVKPMKLDTIFWLITGMPENERPLSLRANGAFACRGVTVVEEILNDEDLDPIASAGRILAVADAGASSAFRRAKQVPFSELLEESALARGLPLTVHFGPTYVTALILENRLDEAQELIRAYREGSLHSRFQFTFNMPGSTERRDYFDLATNYIADRQRSSSVAL